MKYDEITEVSKRYDIIDEIQKFNPYHGKDGRFASSTGYASFTIRTKDPAKQHMADMAIAREKERDAAASANANGTARVAEAENTMRGLLKEGAEVKLKGVDADVADEMVASVKKVMERYPIAKDAIDGIVSDDSPQGMFESNPNAMACFSSETNKIYVNPKYFGNKAEFDKAYDESVKNKFHPEGTKSDSVITHEIGHALDAHVSREAINARDYNWGFDSISQRKWNNDIKAAQKKGEPLTNKSITDGLSRYASKNHEEYFAEGFAEGIHSSQPRKTATSIMKHLNLYVKKATNK